MHPHILRNAHGFQHLRSEHPAIPNFDPLLQGRMKRKDFHRRFSVRVISGFEAKVCDAHFLEESTHESNQIGESQIIISHDTLHLVEFGQMCIIRRLVTENSINAEQLCRFESIWVCCDLS